MHQIVVKKKYPKVWLCHEDQLKRLIARGLLVDDEETARQFLAYSNYYRFTGYCLRFQNVDPITKERRFNNGTTFSDVTRLYEFDRNLRDSIANALETVEISFRSTVAYNFAKSNGPFGHLKPDNFIAKFKTQGIDANGNPAPSQYDNWHRDLVSETERSNELFVRHFRSAYTEFPDLPIWTASEICSFGTLSKMFANMLRQDMREISLCYHLQASVLDTWIHSFVYVRNICAHHSRLWDKTLAIAPQLPPGKMWDYVRQAPKSLYAVAMTLNWMLAHDSVNKSIHAAWKDEFSELMHKFFNEFPQFRKWTGFPTDWAELEVWKSV